MDLQIYSMDLQNTNKNDKNTQSKRTAVQIIHSIAATNQPIKPTKHTTKPKDKNQTSTNLVITINRYKALQLMDKVVLYGDCTHIYNALTLLLNYLRTK